jgi:hypothetical protein
MPIGPPVVKIPARALETTVVPLVCALLCNKTYEMPTARPYAIGDNGVLNVVLFIEGDVDSPFRDGLHPVGVKEELERNITALRDYMGGRPREDYIRAFEVDLDGHLRPPGIYTYPDGLTRVAFVQYKWMVNDQEEIKVEQLSITPIRNYKSEPICAPGGSIVAATDDVTDASSHASDDESSGTER